MKRILIIEDDVNLGTPLAGALEMQDYEVKYLTNDEKALEIFHEFSPDIVILDVMLNGVLDGFQIGKLIREVSNTPILFTTSREGNEDFRTGLSIQYSDYVRKPYKLIEITMRLNNLLSLNQNTTKKVEPISIGHFRFLPEEQSLVYEYEKIHLNNYESAVLALLCQNKNNYMARPKIIEIVWNENNPKLKEASLNNILTKLRKYLSDDPKIGIESKIGLGVRIKLE